MLWHASRKAPVCRGSDDVISVAVRSPSGSNDPAPAGLQQPIEAAANSAALELLAAYRVTIQPAGQAGPGPRPGIRRPGRRALRLTWTERDGDAGRFRRDPETLEPKRHAGQRLDGRARESVLRPVQAEAASSGIRALVDGARRRHRTAPRHRRLPAPISPARVHRRGRWGPRLWLEVEILQEIRIKLRRATPRSLAKATSFFSTIPSRRSAPSGTATTAQAREAGCARPPRASWRR